MSDLPRLEWRKDLPLEESIDCHGEDGFYLPGDLLPREFFIGGKVTGGRFLCPLFSMRFGSLGLDYGWPRVGVSHWPAAGLTSLMLGWLDITLFHWWKRGEIYMHAGSRYGKTEQPLSVLVERSTASRRSRCSCRKPSES